MGRYAPSPNLADAVGWVCASCPHVKERHSLKGGCLESYCPCSNTRQMSHAFVRDDATEAERDAALAWYDWR